MTVSVPKDGKMEEDQEDLIMSCWSEKEEVYCVVGRRFKFTEGEVDVLKRVFGEIIAGAGKISMPLLRGTGIARAQRLTNSIYTDFVSFGPRVQSAGTFGVLLTLSTWLLIMTGVYNYF